MHECPFVPHYQDGSTVFLYDRLPSPMNMNNGIAPPVVVVRQIDDQLIGTTSCDEEASSLLGSSNHIEDREVLDPVSIRNEPVAEGLEAQDNAPTPPTN